MECSSYETCSAPLCPLDPTLDNCTWFADEEICSNREHRKEKWVKTQRKIAKRTNDPDRGCWTVEMLKSISRVSQKVTGKNPEYI